MSINKKITFYFLSIITCSSVFLAYGILLGKDSKILVVDVVFVAIVFALFISFIIVLKKHMMHIMTQLSEVIASLIDMRENEVFSVLDDDMLSKLQSQVSKLAGILRMQNSKLKSEKNEIKSLISDISHQLKTPLANLNIYINLLMDEELEQSEKQEFIKHINNQVEKLNWLMESMIKMTRLESGIIQLNPEISSLNDTLLTSVKQVYQKASKKGIEIFFVPQSDIQLIIDKKWTTEAITNILDNAVKYTQLNGKIKINVQVYELYVRVDIEDNGIGIDESEFNDVFKRFYRGKNTKSEDGVGIGLYLTREIISMQEGYIKLKSKVTAGSQFSVFLPLR